MAERVIWEREIDRDRFRDRNARFQKMFGVPATIVFVAVLIFGGLANAIGVLIVLAIVGVSWGMTVRFQNLSDAANPRLTVDRGRIVLGNRDVIIEDVKRYCVIATVLQTSFVGKLGEIQLGKVIFRMDMPGTRSEPDLVEFGWPNMAPEDTVSLQDALEPVLAGKWVEPEDLLDPEERHEESQKRGRRGRKRPGG